MNFTKSDMPHWNDNVHQSQQTFRSLLRALSRPCLPVPLPLPEGQTGALTPELAALALTLCDQDTKVWLSPSLDCEEVCHWLRFQCGTAITEASGEADFAFAATVQEMPKLSSLSCGSPEYPDRSATLCVGGMKFDRRSGTSIWKASGPGIQNILEFTCNLPDTFMNEWSENHQHFPQGVDIFLCGQGMAAGLPRSTSLTLHKENNLCM